MKRLICFFRGHDPYHISYEEIRWSSCRGSGKHQRSKTRVQCHRCRKWSKWHKGTYARWLEEDFKPKF